MYLQARATAAAEALIEPMSLLPRTSKVPLGYPGGALAMSRMFQPKLGAVGGI